MIWQGKSIVLVSNLGGRMVDLIRPIRDVRIYNLLVGLFDVVHNFVMHN